MRGDHRTVSVGDSQLASPPFRVLLLAPLSGASGIWGPSALHAAKVAVGQINQTGGVGGRPVELIAVDAGQSPDQVAKTLARVLSDQHPNAVVGLHSSDLKPSVVAALGGALPYVFTPLHEGEETARGVFTIGELPDQYIYPAIDWLMRERGVTAWSLFGSDFVGPRTCNRAARRYLEGKGAQVLDEAYFPVGASDYTAALERLAASSADCVLLSLLGDEAVYFNRAFAEFGLADRIVRLTFAVEENMLLAIGDEASQDLFAAAGYFASTPTPENAAFLKAYYDLGGPNAPPPNSLGESCYEGLHFLQALVRAAGATDLDRLVEAAASGVTYSGARGALFHRHNRSTMPAYLATARGGAFEIVARL